MCREVSYMVVETEKVKVCVKPRKLTKKWTFEEQQPMKIGNPEELMVYMLELQEILDK